MTAFNYASAVRRMEIDGGDPVVKVWGVAYLIDYWGRRMVVSEAWLSLGSFANSVNRRFINSRADSFCRHFTEAVFRRLEGH